VGMKGTKEADVLRGCLQYLKLRGIPAWRANSGGATFAGPGGRRRFVRFTGARGCADILGILPRVGGGPSSDGRRYLSPRTGVFLAVECKAGKGRLTAEQEAFLDAVRKAGGVSLVVHSVSELVEELERLGG
jgi:hypothetical protein